MKQALPKRKASMPDSVVTSPVALTLKVDHRTFVRLSALRATTRRSHQEILMDELLEYLDSEGA